MPVNRFVLLGALLLPAVGYAQQPQRPLTAPEYIERRVGSDAMMIIRLLDENAALRAEIEKLKTPKEEKKPEP